MYADKKNLPDSEGLHILPYVLCANWKGGKVRMCKDLGHSYRRFCGIVEEILQVAQGMAWAGVMMRVTFSREGSCLTEMICRTQTVSLLKDWRSCT